MFDDGVAKNVKLENLEVIAKPEILEEDDSCGGGEDVETTTDRRCRPHPGDPTPEERHRHRA